MSRNDRTILLLLPLLVGLGAFWFMVVSPKQDKAKKLQTQVTQAQDALAQEQQSVQDGLQARKHFPQDYHRLVVMGKAVPVDDETASLIVQINRTADRSGISFRKIDLAQGSGAAAAASATTTTTPPSASSSSSDSSSSSGSTDSSSTSAAPVSTGAAPATETSAAQLPIGAAVGSAGLPTLPYSLTFRGDYFQIANFMAGIDNLVKTGKGRIQADGRLATIDAFALAPSDQGPGLDANLSVTTYLTPSSQGLTGGATPSGPSATLASSTTPVTP